MVARADFTPRLGGKSAVLVFAVTLLSFVVESQLAQYVQSTLKYHQPFLIFYIVHASFSIIFPMHVLYLLATTKDTIPSLSNGLSIAINRHLTDTSAAAPFPYARFLLLSLALTLGITLPALLWFAAVSLSSVSDITAIWNTNAFFAYIIAVKLLDLKWESKRLVAVVVATLGVVAVVYGGSTDSAPAELKTGSLSATTTMTRHVAPLIGDVLTLFASAGYGFYQVLYKKYAALPSDPDEVIPGHDAYTPLPDSEDRVGGAPEATEDATYTLPFGLHSNLLTSMIGVCTLLLLWIPIPLLHWTGIEPFAPPVDLKTIASIAGIALSGVMYNAGFMILLGVWGPITTSVGGLLTIVLVFLSDVIIHGATEAITFYRVLGSGAIVVAFGMLAYDMYQS